MNDPYPPFSESEGGSTASGAGDPPSTMSPAFKTESDDVKTRRASDDVKTAARAPADEFRDKAEHAWSDVQQRASSFHKEIEEEVRQNPTKAIFSVLGIGFLLGLIFRR